MSSEAAWDQADLLKFGWRRPIRAIVQGQNSECGLACVGMIANYYGSRLDLVDLRKMNSNSARGMSLAALTDLAGELGLHSRAIRVELDEIANVRLPAIIHFDANHFVVLERVRSGKYYIVDPQSGTVRMTRKNFSPRFTGIVMELMPVKNFTPFQGVGSSSLLSLFGSVKGVRSSLTWLFLLALALEVTVLVSPLFVQSVVDTVIVNHDESLLATIAIAYFLLLTIQIFISSVRTWSVNVVSTSLLLGWSANVFRRLLRLPNGYFESRSLGDISSRFGSLADVQQAVSVGLLEAAMDSCVAALTLAVLFLYDPLLAWIVLAGVLSYILLRLAALRAIMDNNIDVISALARQETNFIESVRSVALVRRGNKQAFQTAKYVNHLNESQRKNLDLQALQTLFSGAGSLLFGAVKILVIFLGAKQAMLGSLTAGMLVAFIFYVDQFTGRASKLVDFVIGLRVAKVHIDRVSDITSTAEEGFLEGSYKGPLFNADVELVNVSFRYGHNEPWLLHGQDLHVASGECIAICGPSGVGKSTLVKILSGDLDPLAGSLRLGGIDIQKIGKRRFREIVSTVTQDDNLMSGSITQNITGFSPEPDDEFAMECARVAGVHDEVMAMPMRYETLIGDLGVLVSGGQKQRLCLARALYRRPRVLILDEATSHLDPATESKVSAALAELNCTRILIAHRSETLISAGKVTLLNYGKLQPLNKSQAFAEL